MFRSISVLFAALLSALALTGTTLEAQWRPPTKDPRLAPVTWQQVWPVIERQQPQIAKAIRAGVHVKTDGSGFRVEGAAPVGPYIFEAIDSESGRSRPTPTNFFYIVVCTAPSLTSGAKDGEITEPTGAERVTSVQFVPGTSDPLSPCPQESLRPHPFDSGAPRGSAQ